MTDIWSRVFDPLERERQDRARLEPRQVELADPVEEFFREMGLAARQASRWCPGCQRNH